MSPTYSIIWGTVATLFGSYVLASLAHHSWIEAQPDAEDENLLIPLLAGVAIVAIGAFRLRSGLRRRSGDRGSET